MTHVTHIENLASQLKDLGSPQSDDEIMAKIVGSLPTDYANFESNWDGMKPEDRSLSLLRARLVQESRKIKQRQEKAAVTQKTTNEVLSTLGPLNKAPPTNRQEPTKTATEQEGGAALASAKLTGPKTVGRRSVIEMLTTKMAHRPRSREQMSPPYHPKSTRSSPHTVLPLCREENGLQTPAQLKASLVKDMHSSILSHLKRRLGQSMELATTQSTLVASATFQSPLR